MLKDKARIFKALSDTNRLRILNMLKVKPLCVCEITNILKLATSTVSKHLTILRQTDFITEEKDKKWVNYMINPKPDPYVHSILKSLDSWISDEQIIINDREKVKEVDRYKICGG